MTTEIPTIALTVEQARASIGLSRTLIYSLIGTGELRTVKVGRRRLVRCAEIERFLVAKEEGSAGVVLAVPAERGASDAR